MFHNLNVEQTIKALDSTKKGLTKEKAEKILEKNGLNKLHYKKPSNFKLFFSQFNDFIVYILLFALLISIILPFFENKIVVVKDFFDAFAILLILIINASLGYFQERKTQKAIELLKELSSLKTIVIRDGKQILIDSEKLVVGDIVLIDAGTKISADGRLIENVELQVNESSLTGESVPSKKHIKIIKGHVGLGDMKNMVFSLFKSLF